MDSCVRRWISSLLHDRIITYETYGKETSVIPTRGTPQGGVLSPTLWNLVIDELLKRLRREGVSNIGFADDIAVICKGKFLNTICETTQRALSIVEKWCKEVGLGINPNKSELVVFTRRRDLSGFVAPKLFGKPLERAGKVKYLGITFTPNLNWSEHIKHRINKSMKIFWCCKRAIGRNWGLNPKNLIWLHTAIVRPMLAYGSFIWWRGTEIANNCKLLNHLQRTISLAITGAAKTAPQLALEVLLSLPKLETYIHAEARVTALRLQSRIKLGYSWRRDHASVLEDALSDHQNLRAPADYMPPMFIFDRRYRVITPTSGEWERSYGANSLQNDRWYTNISITNNVSGFGILNSNTGTEYCGPLGIDIEETQANIAVIFWCCTEIMNNHVGNNPIQIYTASLGAIKALRSHKIESKLLADCVSVLSMLASRQTVMVVWTPPNTGTEYIAKAKILAVKGTSTAPAGPEPFFPITERKWRRISNNWAIEELRQKWRATTECAHTKYFISEPDNKLTNHLLGLNKLKMSVTVGLITGHMRLNKYLNILGLRDDPDCDRCGGGTETAIHFLCHCPGYRTLRKTIFGCEHLNAREAIASNLSRLFRFALESNRFPSLGSVTTTSLSLNRSSGRVFASHAISPSPQRPIQQTIG